MRKVVCDKQPFVAAADRRRSDGCNPLVVNYTLEMRAAEGTGPKGESRAERVRAKVGSGLLRNSLRKESLTKSRIFGIVEFACKQDLGIGHLSTSKKYGKPPLSLARVFPYHPFFSSRTCMIVSPALAMRARVRSSSSPLSPSSNSTLLADLALSFASRPVCLCNVKP